MTTICRTGNRTTIRPIECRKEASESLLSSIKKVAPMALFIWIAISAPIAKAGPIAYAACITACSAITGGAFIPACIAACAPALAAPTP